MLIIRWPKQDRIRRFAYERKELNKLVLKGLLSNNVFNFDDRVYFFKCFQGYFFKFSISYLRNSCLFTGHARAVFRRFKLCRHSAKAMASSGLLIGLRKSSF